MTRSLVTGAAGFIGSHLCERLLKEGHEVIGLDSFTDYYARASKEANLAAVEAAAAAGGAGFAFIEDDLLNRDLEALLDGVDYCFHLAAQPGVRSSWGDYFRRYVDDNVMATQRLLEAVKCRAEGPDRVGGGLKRLVYASSSSVYGATPQLPASEDAPCYPISPYGVTKLAAEHLCGLYSHSFGLPVVSLRYFTVYGPRQRPDMAFHRFTAAALAGRPVTVYGDGAQTRDVTYVADAVGATIEAARSGRAGEVFNIGGGSAVSINESLDLIEELVGVELDRRYEDAQPGDPRDTLGDSRKARQELAFAPTVDLRGGLAAEVEWLRRESAVTAE